MEAASSPSVPPLPSPRRRSREASDHVAHARVTRQALRAVLENCRMALELFENLDLSPATPEAEDGSHGESLPATDADADELCFLLKSKVESPDFLEKLGSIHMSLYQKINEDYDASWNMITAKDLWEEKQFDGDDESDYIFVSQEDVAESIACFISAYLLTLEQTRELTPSQLQNAICKAFSLKKRKGKLRKAWEGSKVIYNVASWGATAVGIYRNPAILRTAAAAFWSSCGVVAKLI